MKMNRYDYIDNFIDWRSRNVFMYHHMIWYWCIIEFVIKMNDKCYIWWYVYNNNMYICRCTFIYIQIDVIIYNIQVIAQIDPRLEQSKSLNKLSKNKFSP